jgi:asparagine synthase (glutamine-hydrolysing)
MCGVVALYAYSGSAPALDRDELRVVRDHMAARGPDGSGEWFSGDGRVGLGHRRLSIIDLSERGAQPMAAADGKLVISFNGEIYNYRELRSELQALGRTFRTESDTEVLLQLYDEYGTAMLDKLRGMFAFALWDGRRRSILLARDPFGIKPLYYADNGKTLRAASQVNALLRSAAIDTSLEPAGHAGFFLWGSVPNPWTLYRGIRGLPPGHFMWVGEQGADQPRAYCIVADVLAQAAAEPARGDEREGLENIAAALRSSIDAHLVSDVPVGTFLSAGLDSGLLTSLVADRGIRARTLTLAFAEFTGTPNDEAPEADTIARRFGTDHTTMTIRRADFEGEREKFLAAMDQPSIDGLNTWFVARAAAAQGIKVALSGLGGDELFGSYPSFRDIPRMKRLSQLLAPLPGMGVAARKISSPVVGRLTSPKFAGLLEYGGTMGGAYLLRRGLYMPWELPEVMDPDMAREGWRDLRQLDRLNEIAAHAPKNSRLAISALEMSCYMGNQLLADADWAGMAHSIEIRVPLVDVPLLKACAPWFAAQRKLTKRSVVTAAAPKLPRKVLDKPKTGFSVPLRDWLGPTPSSRMGRGLRGWAQAIHTEHVARAHSGNGLKRRPRVLVSTLAPGPGGVNAMTSFVVRTLAERGIEPVIAHYAPYSVAPSLSVPSYRLLQRRTGARRGTAFGNRETHAIGAWLPELEFTHYAASRHWHQLMDSCDAYVAASGNVLAATPFYQTGRPYLAWVATDWEGDRKDRVKEFPPLRRLLDKCLNAPVLRNLEKLLLRSGHIVSLSEYTARSLARIAGRDIGTVILPVAVDCDLFVPNPSARVPGRIGFAGRFNDPRKNIGLLLSAAALLRQRGGLNSVVLMGDTPHLQLTDLIARAGIADRVEFKPSRGIQTGSFARAVSRLPADSRRFCVAFPSGGPVHSRARGDVMRSTRCINAMWRPRRICDFESHRRTGGLRCGAHGASN